MCLITSSLSAGVAYPDPPGGWKYLFNGDKDTAGRPGSGFTSLDGTWSHDNASDQWDGSKIGGRIVAGDFGVGNAPGGVMSVTEDGVTFLRMQDTGNPTLYGFPQPSNEKLYFGHNLTAEGASTTVLDDGITLTFRARVPAPSKTRTALDRPYLDAPGFISDVAPFYYPALGDGFLVCDSGKGNITIKQSSGGSIAFALTVGGDTFTGTPYINQTAFTGLSMNRLNGALISRAVDFDDPGTFNGVRLDLSEWHEFWIVIRKDPSRLGTHQVFVFTDGSKEPRQFSLTAGDSDDFSGLSYLAIGGSSTAQNWALDLDFVGYKTGVKFPAGAFEKPFMNSFGGSLTGFGMDLSDGLGENATKLDPASIRAVFDGVPIAPSVSKKDNITSLTYTSPTLLAAASRHSVSVTFADSGTPTTTQTVEQTFAVSPYHVIPLSTALDDTKLDRAKMGFKIRPYATEEFKPSILELTEDTLAGLRGENTADLKGADTNGFYGVQDVINFDIGSGAGNFTDATGHVDKPFPGFPGSQSGDGGFGNAIEEILTLLEFPKAGLYTMGVNSDDGFRLSTAGVDPRPPADAIVLGEFDGGRSAADTIFSFYAESAGVFAFRLLWENSGGEANLEWFTVQPDGKKVLVNDPATAGALKAYQFQVLPLKPVAVNPTIAIARGLSQLTLTFTGVLQSAEAITGPWIDVFSASSPYNVALSGSQKFYRVKQ